MGRKQYPTYKPSGVAWLGDVPEHWQVKRLIYIASIEYGLGGEIDRSLDNGLKIISLPNIDFEGRLHLEDVPFTEVAEGEKTKILLKKGDLLFNWRNGSSDHLGKTALFNVDGEYSHVSFLLRIRFDSKKQSPRFHRYLIYGYRISGFFKHSKAGVNNTFNLSELAALPMFCPTLLEQEAIADYLDRETAELDRLIEKKKKLIELLKEKRQALISQVVTRGLDPRVKLKPSGVEWLGDIPAHWEVKRLKYIAHLKSGEGITIEEIETEAEYPVYGGNGLRGYTTSYTHDGKFTLIGRQGALCGNINYAQGKFWASEHAVVATPTQNLEVFWLGEVLRVMNLNQYSLSAAQPGLAIDRIKELFLPFPPLVEQEAIATYLNQETAKIDHLVGKIEQAIETLKEYRTALISAAVTGQIDVR